MGEHCLLAELSEGESLKVTKISGDEAFVRRLLDLGLIEGAVVDCVGKSPFGEPKAYRVRGCVLALRWQEAEKIEGVRESKKAGKKDAEKGREKTICLAGNPNVGKSTLFNRLTGLKQHTGNWPGKTVARAVGSCSYRGQSYRLVDLPGCYSLLADSPEEEIARDYICSKEADAVLVVCDGTSLERNLNLALQVLGLTSRVLLCVNLMDEVKRKQMHIDLERLEEELCVPVVGISAREKIDKEQLFQKLEEAAGQPAVAAQALKKQGEKTWGKETLDAEARDMEVQNAEVQGAKTQGAEIQGREALIQRAEEIAKEAICYENAEPDQKDRRLDRLFTSRATGLPIMLGLLFFVFWLTIVGANYPSQLLSRFFLWAEGRLWRAFLAWGLPKPLVELLAMGVFRVTGWVVSVMLPPMALFFPLFTLLEDYGYLPRIAFNLDRCFQCCHACGRQALTMCMGFGCNAVGVSGCRIISSERERMVAILTNNFVPCNGRFPTLIALISMFLAGGGRAFGIKAAGILAATVLFGVLLTFFFSWALGKTVLRGATSAFTLELPPYRRPQPGAVLFRSFLDRTLSILFRAIKASVPAGILIWLMANVMVSGQSLLLHCAAFLEPLAGWMGLDGVILLAFVLGFPANEIVVPIILMAYLSKGSLVEFGSLLELKEILVCHGWTLKTAVCTILFTLLHWPCATTCMTIKKETGSFRWTLLAILLPTLAGVAVCGLVAGIFRCMGM